MHILEQFLVDGEEIIRRGIKMNGVVNGRNERCKYRAGKLLENVEKDGRFPRILFTRSSGWKQMQEIGIIQGIEWCDFVKGGPKDSKNWKKMRIELMQIEVEEIKRVTLQNPERDGRQLKDFDEMLVPNSSRP